MSFDRWCNGGPRRPVVPVVALALALLVHGLALGAWSRVGGAQEGRGDLERGEAVIVVLDRGADPESVARGLGARPTYVYRGVINGFAADLPAAAVDALRRHPRVELVSPDRPVRAFAQALPTGVDRVDADEHPWAAIGGDGGAVDADVAVLDTGIASHKDLKIAGGKACVGKSYADGNGHGTHVAGTVAAKDNDRGVVGVAPGARLWAVKVLRNDGSGTWSSVICGLDWVYRHRGTIDVVNLSLGGPGSDSTCANDALHRAICNVVLGGVTVVVAAGNESQDAANIVPATYDEVIAVSAFADYDGKPGGEGVSTCAGYADDTWARFSNYGSDVDVAAPGVCIRSTWLKGKYRQLSGTSMAAPHVTGVAALYVANNPAATPDDVRAWLLGSASRSQDSPVGFTGDPDAFPEPVLYLFPS